MQTATKEAGRTGTMTGLAALEYGGRIRCPARLKAIGDASYLLYLVHMPAFAVGAIVIGRLGLGAILPPWTMAVLLLTGVTAGSIVLHLWIEKPLVRLASRALGKAAGRAGRSVAA